MSPPPHEIVFHEPRANGKPPWKPNYPPGPPLGIRHGIWILRDPGGGLEDLYRRYGELITFKYTAFGVNIMVGDPWIIKQVFAAGPRRFHTGEGNAILLEPAVGKNSILSLDEDRHTRSRKIMLPPMRQSRMATYEPVIRDITEREIEGWQLRRPFPLVHTFRSIALDVLMDLVVGVREPDRLKAIRDAIEPVANPSKVLIWNPGSRRHLGPWSPWTRYVKKRTILYDLLDEEIARRRLVPDLDEREDILSLLIRSRDEDGKGLTDLELRDELMGVIGAGHHTTTASLAWFFDQVLRQPHIEERLRAELAEGGDDTYHQAAIAEILRWRAPIFGVPRRAMQDIEIGDYRLPKGTMLSLNLHMVHRRPDLYPEPNRFMPERFVDSAPDPITWIPWGGGDRKCIGANFALLEMKVITATIMERFRLELVDTRAERPDIAYVNLFPSRGVQVNVTERLRPAPSEPATAAAAR